MLYSEKTNKETKQQILSKGKNLFLFSISLVKIKYFQSCRARISLWFPDILSSPHWDRYDKHWIKLQEMNWNMFSALLALLVLSVCHLILLIVAWLQGWPARQIDQLFSCAPTFTASQFSCPAGSDRIQEGEQVEVDAGEPGTSTLPRALVCFYSP